MEAATRDDPGHTTAIAFLGRACGLAACLLWLAACAGGRPIVRRTPVRTPAEISAGTVAGSDPDRPVPLDSLLPPDTRSSHGALTVHLARGRVFLEIPDTAGDMLIVLPDTSGAPTTRLVRWERDGQNVLLRSVPADILPASGAIGRAVAALRIGDIVALFPIRSSGAGGAPVIDSTPLFTGAVAELAVLPDVDSSRSFVTAATATAGGVEVDVVQTAAVTGADGRRSTRTVPVHVSLLRLPAGGYEPMEAWPGAMWTVVRATDYGTASHRAEEVRRIRRFRLPIVFRIDPATPAWAVPHVTAGIEEWRSAFADVGLPDAVRAEPFDPAIAEAPFAAQRAAIHWLPSTADSAWSGIVADPRTGEILRAWVVLPHELPETLERRWFVAAAPLDSAARALPLPEARSGALLQAQVARAVGRALGLAGPIEPTDRFPVDSLRSAAFLARMGPLPSILADATVHVVARPGDHVPPERLLPRVGPLDRLALAHGYARDGARPPADTAAWQSLITGRPSDDDERAAALALANLADSATRLIGATERPGRDYTQLATLYGAVLERWREILLSIVERVGGGRMRSLEGGSPALEPTRPAETRAALQFLASRAFTPPRWLLDPAVLRRIEADGSIARIAAAQADVLRALLAPARLGRLADGSARHADAVGPAELLATLRADLFGELRQDDVEIDVLRRALQRTYVDLLARSVEERAASEARAAARQELAVLRDDVRAAQAGAADPATRLHLADVEREITRVLEPAREPR